MRRAYYGLCVHRLWQYDCVIRQHRTAGLQCVDLGLSGPKANILDSPCVNFVCCVRSTHIMTRHWHLPPKYLANWCLRKQSFFDCWDLASLCIVRLLHKTSENGVCISIIEFWIIWWCHSVGIYYIMFVCCSKRYLLHLHMHINTPFDMPDTGARAYLWHRVLVQTICVAHV